MNFTNVTSDLVADTGLHLHALIVSFLRLLLLLLLRGVLRGGLSLPQRLLQVLGSLVGLALAVHRHLRAALVGRRDLLRVVGVGVVAVRASLLRVELDVHRGVEALLVGHVLQFHGFARHVVGFLLLGEVHAAPFADGADAAVGVRPRVAALLLVRVGCVFRTLRLFLLIFLCLDGTGRPAGSRHELHAALLHVHLQGGDELPAVLAFDEFVTHGQTGTQHVLLLLGDFRLADAFRYAHLAGRDIRDFVRLAVDADERGDDLARFPVHEVHDPAEVARFAQVLPVIVGELVFLVVVELLLLADEVRHKADVALAVLLEGEAGVQFESLSARNWATPSPSRTCRS